MVKFRRPLDSVSFEYFQRLCTRVGIIYAHEMISDSKYASDGSLRALESQLFNEKNGKHVFYFPLYKKNVKG